MRMLPAALLPLRQDRPSALRGLQSANAVSGAADCHEQCQGPTLTPSGSPAYGFSHARVMRNGSAAAPVELGALVSSLRIGAGLSMSALARRSACSSSTISRLERGELRPRPSLLRSIAWGLDPDRAAALGEVLFAAAADSRAADSAGWQRYRWRRQELGMITGDVPLPRDIARRVAAHKRAAAARAAAGRLTSGAGWVDDAETMARASELLAEAQRLDDEAGGMIGIGTGHHRVVYGGW